jgi:sarcosine/dimethylglycine N-methyltransferase
MLFIIPKISMLQILCVNLFWRKIKKRQKWGVEMLHESYNFSVGDVSAVYAGPGGKLWELLMGEQIHVGGAKFTEMLADKIDLKSAKNSTSLLDICSALGGPARFLAEKYKIHVVGLDITPEMVNEAKMRTDGKSYASLIEFRIGSALDIPAKRGEFDIVWGQDAWCYIRDKNRLLQEINRVLKSNGTLVFTDWIWGSNPISKAESDCLMEFMVFPDLQSLDGYSKLLKGVGLKLTDVINLNQEFSWYMDEYLAKILEAKSQIIQGFGKELYEVAEKGIKAWNVAAHKEQVGLGLWIAHKP